MRFLQRIRKLFRDARKTGCRSDEDEFEKDIARLDCERSDWDRNARVQAAGHALTDGVSRQTVIEIYGDETVREAEKIIGK